MKYILPFILFCCACSHKPDAKSVRKPQRFHYKSFEMTYASDFSTGSMSIRTDSTGLFILFNQINNIYYGFLPDSLKTCIDSVVWNMAQDSSVKNNYSDCVDCDRLSVLIVNHQDDTLKLFQKDRVHPFFYQVSKRFKMYVNAKYKPLPGIAFFQTHRDVHPPPTKKYLEMIVKEEEKKEK